MKQSVVVIVGVAALGLGLRAESSIALTGIVGSGETALVALVDAQGVTSSWLKAGQSFRGYTISEINADHGVVLIRKGDEQIVLSLRRPEEGKPRPGPAPDPQIARKTITNNLRQLDAAFQQYCLENGVDNARLDQLIGPDKYIRALPAVDGEDYAKLELSIRVPSWSVTTAHGMTVTYERR